MLNNLLNFVWGARKEVHSARRSRNWKEENRKGDKMKLKKGL